MEKIAFNIKKINKCIEAAAIGSGRTPGSVRLMAVTKKQEAGKINEAISSGIALIGENRVQEASKKSPDIKEKVECHLIGHLQKNKVKYVFNLFDLIQTVDSKELANEINKRAIEKNIKMDVLIQVNVSGESTKFGVSPDKTLSLIEDISLLSNISVKGLMTIPPYSDNPENSRPYFKQLFELKNDINKAGIKNVFLEELSMGMSGDFEVAIEEGSTIVRVGSAIFGERN